MSHTPRFLTPLLLLVVGLGLMGSTESPSTVRPTLQIVWYCAALQEALKHLASTYPEAQVEVRCAPFNRWHDEIAEGFAKKAGADLVILDSQFIGEAVAGGHIVELTDWMKSNLDLEDYVPGALTTYGEYPAGSGRYYAVPAFADAQLLIYRRDLYEDPKIGAAYAKKTGGTLAVPSTWTELLRHAQFFHGSPWVSYGYAATWKGPDGYDEISTQWNQILWSFGGELWDPKTARIEGVLNRPEALRALQLAKSLLETGPQGAEHFSFEETIRALCDGTTAIGNVWFVFGPTFLDKKRCRIADRLAFGIVPGEVKHVISVGGQGISVSAYTRQKDAALRFVKWFTSSQIQQEWVKAGAASARISILKSDRYLTAAPYNKYFAATFERAKDFWNLPEYADLLQIEQDYLHRAVTGRMKPTLALDTMAKRQQAVLDGSASTRPGGR